MWKTSGGNGSTYDDDEDEDKDKSEEDDYDNRNNDDAVYSDNEMAITNTHTRSFHFGVIREGRCVQEYE